MKGWSANLWLGVFACATLVSVRPALGPVEVGEMTAVDATEGSRGIEGDGLESVGMGQDSDDERAAAEASLRLLLSKRLKLIIEYHQSRIA